MMPSAVLKILGEESVTKKGHVALWLCFRTRKIYNITKAGICSVLIDAFKLPIVICRTCLKHPYSRHTIELYVFKIKICV
jgi:hypothetical protein